MNRIFAPLRGPIRGPWGVASLTCLMVSLPFGFSAPSGAPSVIIAVHSATAQTLSPSGTSTSGVKTPAPWPKVTPRRLAPPKSGTGSRINVQIRPSAPSGPSAPQAPSGPSAPGAPRGPNVAGTAPAVPNAPKDLQDWFWDVVPHDLVNAAPERFGIGLAALGHPKASSLSTPSFQKVTDIANAHGTDILIASIDTQISPALALAVISVESAGKITATSSAGAQGLMQLIPATAERFGVTDAMDPSQNIRGGITYLDWLVKEFRGDVLLALAGYNAGENAVKNNNGVPPYAETRAYVPKVLAAWEITKRLCVTQPQLYSDGCVFATSAVK